jgi:hypothetical protein
MRDYLLFVRAGPQSLHRRLIRDDPQRNWDCCVSWYCEAPIETVAEHYRTAGDNKFEAFEQFFLQTAGTHPYRYYLVVDDDIDFAAGDISRFFELCRRHRTYLSQPALRWGTNANHHVTLWNPLCRVRRTSYVEVMTPCFSREAVEFLLPTFRLTRSTWGIDYAWSSLLRDMGRISIIDAVRVAHTKPVDMTGGAFYRKLERQGIDAQLEYGEIKRTYPRFGALATLRRGHALILPIMPQALAWPLVRLMESLKKRIHSRL